MCACAACDFALERDCNACRNMVRWSIEGQWWDRNVESGPGTAPETPSEKAASLAPVE